MYRSPRVRAMVGLCAFTLLVVGLVLLVHVLYWSSSDRPLPQNIPFPS